MTIKLLVVEDNPEITDLYRESFAKEPKIEARYVTDGGHAAGILRTEAFDAAILDIKLPGINGLQIGAIARSSKLNRRMTIFVVSGNLDDQARSRSASLGAFKVIDKPFDLETLPELVLNAVEKNKPASGYDVKVINALLKATSEVLEFYFGVPPQIGKPNIRKEPSAKRSGVTGLIGISGETFAGSLGIFSSKKFLEILATKVFQNSGIQLNDEMVGDLMGETCNQVCGRLKIAFATLGIKSNIGLPEVVIGSDHIVVHKVQNPLLFVTMTIGGQSCEIEFCLMQRTGFVVNEDKKEDAVSGVLLFD